MAEHYAVGIFHFLPKKGTNLAVYDAFNVYNMYYMYMLNYGMPCDGKGTSQGRVLGRVLGSCTMQAKSCTACCQATIRYSNHKGMQRHIPLQVLCTLDYMYMYRHILTAILTYLLKTLFCPLANLQVLKLEKEQVNNIIKTNHEYI